jgi:hypothetical protein
MNLKRFNPAYPLVLWMVAVVLAYVSGTYIWMNPEYLRWGLPFFRVFPPVAVFFLRLAGLVLGLAVLGSAGLYAGNLAGRFIRVGRGSRAGNMAIGWIALGTLEYGLGLAGLWWGPMVAAVVIIPALAGMPGLARSLRGGPAWFTGFLSFPSFLLPVSLAAWVLILLCLSPEAFQDPLRYHLFIPGQFLAVHKIFFYRNFFFWSYMGPLHMLYAAGLAVAGTSGAKAVNLACALLCLAVLDRIAGRLGLGRGERALLQALTITAPGWVFVTGSAFMEHGGVLYILLALDAMLDAGRSHVSRARDLFLFTGLAASVKYTAVFGGFGLALMVLFSAGQRDWERAFRRRWTGLAGLLALANIPWALARWVWTGDPVSPLLAKAGYPTMDSSSTIQLSAAYEFTRGAVEKWLANPAELFSYPIVFSGSHGGFWEHPGPALVCLLPVMVVGWKSIAPLNRSLLWFFGGSVGFWLVFFGGVSPHYIVAYGGIWCAIFLSAVPALPGAVQSVAMNLLMFTAFYQALMMLSTSTTGFFPRDVAVGAMSREQYLDVAVVSKRIYRPVRRAIEERLPGRGVVYTYGDDKGYYLSGRVCLDYDFGSDPLLWKLAAESRDPEDLRRHIRQRGWTHMIYATYWPDYYENEKSLEYRFGPRVLVLVQEFWRKYAELSMRAEIPDEDGVKGAYVFAFRPLAAAARYAMDGGDRLPFLPGAEALFLPGDRMLRDRKPDEAAEFYARMLARFPDFAVLHERLGRLAMFSGNIKQARFHVKALEGSGWMSESLRRLAWPAAGGRAGKKPPSP